MPTRKLYKHTTWVVFVTRGHIAIHIRFCDLYWDPCYEDLHAPGSTIRVFSQYLKLFIYEGGIVVPSLS